VATIAKRARVPVVCEGVGQESEGERWDK